MVVTKKEGRGEGAFGGNEPPGQNQERVMLTIRILPKDHLSKALSKLFQAPDIWFSKTILLLLAALLELFLRAWIGTKWVPLMNEFCLVVLLLIVLRITRR